MVGRLSGTISTAAKFHWWMVGAVSLNSTTVPAAATGSTRFCTQNVSPDDFSAWNTNACPAAGVRASSPSQSFPTPYTSEPLAVAVSETWAAPLGAEATADAPTPPDHGNVTTVKDNTFWPGPKSALTVMSDRVFAAVAFQIS